MVKYLLLFSFLLGCSVFVKAQNTAVNINGSKGNAITTAVPFLDITPDARSGGMGEAGVAISPDASATFWNPSKLAFVTESSDISLSYTPWMRQLTSDINLGYLSYYKKLDDRNTIAASMRYFNLGNVDGYDNNFNSLGTLHPNEYSFDVSLARKFGEGFSLGLTARYIHSDLTQGAGGNQASAANGFAADASMYYRSTSNFAFGVDISNIGTKMNYSIGQPSYFLPTNLKIGAAQTVDMDDLNKITFTVDLNKLLVPTPRTYTVNGTTTTDNGQDVSIVNGIFESFSDAPGGLKEELQEISVSPGVEYWYNQQLALRAGYLYENPNKGDRHYLTLGIGYRFDNLGLDFSYVAASEQSTPLAGGIRFSLNYSFGSIK